ncbi:hypothetical protein QM588_05150 [Rhodococcus sp. IEGM 1354]|uniref:hypothetical protein n=1 Tax=Rhodococcus sp. IEGM 1354 TaxID=3047088 RepID=UPI0024B73196|nr:hypothetical protein [Rhodococcus sp. IEGM 1354]MDI9929784.1 hypothetical protein [Rhodococcus sp. IEGM 1354]
MGVLSKGRVQLTPVRFKSSHSLDAIADAAAAASYPEPAEAGGKGWGSTRDEADYVGNQVPARLKVAHPSVLEPTNYLPRRLRLRYYWHTLEPKALRFESGRDDWRVSHTLSAADVILFEAEEGESSATGLISIRDTKILKSHVFGPLADLIRNSSGIGSIETDSLPEALNPDFFKWLLHRTQATPDLGGGLGVSSMTSLDTSGDSGGTKFTEETALERIELAAAVAIGRREFGPAKVAVSQTGIGNYLLLDLFRDGGFAIKKDSMYDSPPDLPDEDAGFWLAEHIWSVVLPALRAAYASDTKWAADGAKNFESQAIDIICQILIKLGRTTLMAPQAPSKS